MASARGKGEASFAGIQAACEELGAMTFSGNGLIVGDEVQAGLDPILEAKIHQKIQSLALQGAPMMPHNAKLLGMSTMRFPNSPMTAVTFEMGHNNIAKSIAIPIRRLDDFKDVWTHTQFDPLKATTENLNPHARKCFECILRVRRD